MIREDRLNPMTDSMTLVPTSQPLVTNEADFRGVIEHFLSGLKANTLRTYQQGFDDFVSFLSRRENRPLGREEVVYRLLAQGHGNANILGHEYLVDMQNRNLSANSINNRLSALRKLVAVARVRGLVAWSLEVRNVTSQPYRDTRGPGTQAVQMLLNQVAGSRPKDVRDKAIIRLLFDLSLRRNEVVGLDVEDVELNRQTIRVLRKGKTEKVLLDLPKPTAKVLLDWLEVRGTESGALFINFDRARKGKRLSGTSLYRNLKKLGDCVDVDVSPHKLRHTGITVASTKATQAGYRQRDLIQYSGHSSSTTLDFYIDSIENLQGKIACLVAAELV